LKIKHKKLKLNIIKELSTITTMLTRHFYESEDVLASMRMAILRGRSQEALFWCLELIDTNLHKIALQHIIETWMLFFTGSNWIEALKNNYSLKQQSILEACYSLSQEKQRTVSSIELLVLEFEEKKEKVAVDDFRMAVRAGQGELAWSLAKSLDAEVVWSALTEFENSNIHWIRSLISSFKVKTPLWLFGIIQWLCLRKEESVTWVPLTDDLQKKIKEWKGLLSRRKRRQYAIPFPLLYGETSKSSVLKSKSTLDRLYIIEKSMCKEEGFWKNVLEFSDFDIESAKWTSDDALELFYEKYFPDDIPDEWSLIDQEKSHGNGLGEEPRSLTRWLRAWSPPDCTLASHVIRKAMEIQWPKDQKSIIDYLLLH
jgi:hypothetical protein